MALDQEELEQLRQMLLEKRSTLLGDIQAMEEELAQQEAQPAGGMSSSMPTHPADLGSDTFDRELTAREILRQRRRLVEIEEAIGRMDSGSYGLCQSGGESIEKKRLLAKPWARHCLQHAAKEE